MLTQDGFGVDISRSAGEAEERLSRNTYDAMTLDLGLDDKDGVTLIRELRQNPKTKSLPIVVISARAKEGAKELNGDAIGIIDWLEKPIDHERLTECLRQAVPLSTNDKARILHVEDDLDVLQIVSALVADIAEITPAETLSQAKALLAQQTFDLVVLDLMLPDGRGEDLLPLLNQQDRSPTPVVIFSVKDASKQTAEHVKSTLVKSMSSNETLLNTIHSAIASGRSQLKKPHIEQAGIGA